MNCVICLELRASHIQEPADEQKSYRPARGRQLLLSEEGSIAVFTIEVGKDMCGTLSIHLGTS